MSHIMIRRFHKKSFTLPKIDFIFKNVEVSDDRKNSQRHNSLTITRSKNDYFKIKQSQQKSRPKFQFDLRLTTSVNNTLISDKEALGQQYSEDLFEIDSLDFDNKLKKKRVANALNYCNTYNVAKLSKHVNYYQNSDKKKTNLSLLVPKDREIIYGIFPVMFALQENRRTFYNLFIKNDILKKNEKVQLMHGICLKNNITINFVPQKILQQLTNTDAVHQGVCLEASHLPVYFTDENSLEPVCSGNTRCWLYLNAINDPMNLGAILRTAYFLGIEKVLSSSANNCSVTSVVSKASAGIAELFPIYTVLNDERYLLACQKFGWQIVSSSSSSAFKNSMEIGNFQPKRNIILIIGNEGRGISKELLDLSDVCVSIPPHEKSNTEILSLNASVATSIILFSIMSKLKCTDTLN